MFMCRFLLTSSGTLPHVLLAMTSETGTRVAIYARVSTKDKGQDVKNQTLQLHEFCQRQGWTVVKEYTDRASGKRGDRVAFNEMFDAASRREFDTVLFWSLDRFSREGVRETLNYLERLTSYGIGYRSFTEQYLDSCGMFKDAVIGILAVIAKQERVRLSERVHAGLVRARKSGRVGGRPRKVVSHDKVLKLHGQGVSAVKIGEQLGISRMTVARIVAAEA
jgi:DNA invertase Pin-like site-specific DNA recombinase